MTAGTLRRFESRAIGSYTLRTTDLAVFRFLYAGYMLTSAVPKATWAPLAPHAFYRPPPGPLAFLFATFPPEAAVWTLNGLLALFSSMLLAGWKTRTASVGTGLAFLALEGCEYSVGKINHEILLAVTPLVLCFAGWGRALSADAFHDPPAAEGNAEAWPLALLAMMIGLALFTAGWAKARTGWLDPERLCCRGHFLAHDLTSGRDVWAVRQAIGIESIWFWKVLDYGTVFLEFAFLPAALNRRWFCGVLAVATFFHLGVLVLFDIAFGANIVAYGAFVRWTELPLLRSIPAAAPLRRWKGTFATALGLGLFAVWMCNSVGSLLHVPLRRIVVWAAPLAATFLIARARETGQPREEPNDESPGADGAPHGSPSAAAISSSYAAGE